MPLSDTTDQLVYPLGGLELASDLIASLEEPGDASFTPPGAIEANLGPCSLPQRWLILPRQAKEVLGPLDRRFQLRQTFRSATRDDRLPDGFLCVCCSHPY